MFFKTNSKEDMHKQFASSNKVIKEVTSELEKNKRDKRTGAGICKSNENTRKNIKQSKTKRNLR